MVVWFRRDLRIHDHPALRDAVENAACVYPLFVFDEPLLSGRWPSPNPLSFMPPAHLPHFDPTLQAARFDPKGPRAAKGALARRWLPEMADVPDEFIHEPWR
ncbi:MAG: deoxyribodipyrimidine photo-lyase [Chloroflexota bacterium]|nr:deoxyribodipyrimidine photo-lyase [Chloroflexota bacterium]